MSIQIYKPNSRNTGHAASFQASDKDGSLYINLIKQASWDDTRKKGSFMENKGDPQKSTTIKLNQVEAATIIDAIERFYPYQTIHQTPSKMTNIAFAISEDSTKFSLSVKQTDKEDTTKITSFFLSLTLGEARLLKEYFVHYLHKSFKIDRKPQSKTAPAAPQESVAETVEQTPEPVAEVVEDASW